MLVPSAWHWLRQGLEVRRWPEFSGRVFIAKLRVFIVKLRVFIAKSGVFIATMRVFIVK